MGKRLKALLQQFLSKAPPTRKETRLVGRNSQGEKSLPPLLQTTLRAPKWQQRQRAAQSLSQQALLAEEALPILLQSLTSRDWELRYHATEALGKLKAHREEIIPALLQTLQDREHWVRESAALSLGELEPCAQEAALLLARTALQDWDEDVRWSAASTLKKMGPRAKVTVPTMVNALQDPDKEMCIRAIEALEQLGPHAAEALPHLLPFSQDPNPAIRVRTIAILGQFEVHATQVLPALLQALKDPDTWVQTHVIKIWKRVPLAYKIEGMRSLKEKARMDGFSALQAKTLETWPFFSVCCGICEESEQSDVAALFVQARQQMEVEKDWDIEQLERLGTMTQGLMEALETKSPEALRDWQICLEYPLEQIRLALHHNPPQKQSAQSIAASLEASLCSLVSLLSRGMSMPWEEAFRCFEQKLFD
ncbi:MAG: HEAT repeat domain-containing protein [Myxococcales bacterium]|nr:HEAT repeat domain-containing protein [Myxococcales bacterium]